MVLDIAFFIAGLLLLYFGSLWLVKGSASLAHSLGIRPIVIGLTVVAFGTSAPELVISLVSALKGKSMIAVGNVVGSNIFNLTAITGIASLVRPIEVQGSVLREEYPATLLLTLAFLPIARTGYVISRFEGGLLLTMYVVIWVLVFH